MFDTLSDRLSGIFTKLRGKGRLTDADIDATAREIRLALLEADGRKSTSEIARLTNLSAPTVAERIARMRDIGVIKGFTVRIDAAKVGLPVAAIVEFQPRASYDTEALNSIIRHGETRTSVILVTDVEDRPLFAGDRGRP